MQETGTKIQVSVSVRHLVGYCEILENGKIGLGQIQCGSSYVLILDSNQHNLNVYKQKNPGVLKAHILDNG